MAPRKLTQIERWIGTEAERLALDASGFSPGSTFFERDTGSMYKWDGTSWGKEIITVADIAGIKTAIESLDNKELATELTLAQILTILGGTAADIGTLKLENGQIKGYDGTDWQPVRVNDAGELILASEVTVNAEGLSVDLGKLVLQAKNPSGVPVDMKSDTEGNLKVSLSGTKVVESAPVTGIKTVTSTVAEVFAGSSRKANRSKLVIRNRHQAVAIRIGGSGITDTIGQSVEPGASVEIDFSPSTAVPIYAVSTAGNVSVEVLEV